MNRFEYRMQRRLQNEEIAEGYREMAAELERVNATATKSLFRQTDEVEGSDKVVMDLTHPQTWV